jgi:dipeptidyl-peptidase-4
MPPRVPRSSYRWPILIGLLCLLAPTAKPAAAQDGDSLTLDRIYASPEFFARGAGQIHWLEDGGYTVLAQSDSVEGGTDIVRVDPRTGNRTVLVDARQLIPRGAEAPLAIEGYRWSADGGKLLVFTNGQRVWRYNTRGDYWVLDRASGRLHQVGADRPVSSLMYAKFSPDGTRVGFVSENDLYVQDLGSGAVTRLTRDGSRTILNGRFDWVYEEELFFFAPDGADGWRWSPDGQRIAYWQLDAGGVRDFLLINNTDSLYSFAVPVQFPKAGTTNSAARVGIVPAAGGQTVWLQVPGDPRDNYVARLEWAASPDEVVIQHLNRLQNTLQIMLGDARTGAVRTIVTERDSAWLDAVDDLRWLEGGERFTWLSDRDGWQRLYVINRDGSGARAVTPERADVIGVRLIDEKGGWAYYYASPEEPTRRYLFRARLTGVMQVERLTPAGAAGWHGYTVSPDARYAVHTFSNTETPTVSTIVSLPDHETVRTLNDNAALRDKVARLKSRTRFFRVKTVDGVVMDGWMQTPRDFDPSKKYPVLFHVYGEPAAQTVTDAWGGNQSMWHQYLADHGYVVMSLDNRGTPAPRGRAWRKAVYQKMGRVNSRDQAMGVRAVADSFPFVDTSRIGIWGWSGGGSSTLNAMFRYPDLYHTGMAVAPVPDLRYYDTIYQERYTGHPALSPEAYEQGSPITFAHQLKGNLLIVHGTGDDNVHYQGTEALINTLIEHGKHFTMMAYPNRTHGIFEGRGTTRHVYGLLTRYLFENLPAGGRQGSEGRRPPLPDVDRP